MDVVGVVLVGVAAVAAGLGHRAAAARRRTPRPTTPQYLARLEDLEAAKEARYREIREAEMDYRTGKLDEADWKAIDRQLRQEAMELLRRLDALGVRDE